MGRSRCGQTQIIQVLKESKGIDLGFSEPGKPQQSAYIERFNKTYYYGVLNAYLVEKPHLGT